MKSLTIQGAKRESVGKQSTKALRNADQVPCVVYGKSEPVHFSTHELSFKDLIYTPEAHTVVLALESGESINAILQDVQFHPVTDKILHADFYELQDDKEVTLNIPVRLEGRARGVLNGGVLRFNLRKLKVKAIPANLPDEIVVDISELKIGSKTYIGDIKSDNFTFLHPDNAVVVAVKTSRNAVEEEEDEEEGEAAEGAEEAPAAE